MDIRALDPQTMVDNATSALAGRSPRMRQSKNKPSQGNPRLEAINRRLANVKR